MKRGYSLVIVGGRGNGVVLPTQKRLTKYLRMIAKAKDVWYEQIIGKFIVSSIRIKRALLAGSVILAISTDMVGWDVVWA